MTSKVPAALADFDRHLFGEGRHWHAQEFLGAHASEAHGIAGTRFAVWAPHARAVSVAGDFNAWSHTAHPLRGSDSGVWEGFLAGIGPGALYKFAIQTPQGEWLFKSDPYGRLFEMRPATSSVVAAPSAHVWTDAEWIARRRETDWQREPVSIYELHLGSWQREASGGFLNYREIARRLVPYVVSMGFTHVELLPVSEHPFDGSWGYQTTGLYAPTRRHGEPDDFRWFVDHCHANGIGVILDWVPAHFPKDAHGLRQFDGLPLYEYPDAHRGEHPEWGTLIYDYGRPQVRNFLMSNALYWIEEFHVDGLRVDAVASMLYLSYGRNPGQWQPNRHGGSEHLEAVQFLRDFNQAMREVHPGALVIAEESTSWPDVSGAVEHGGLGFSMKWDLGWMHDALDYFKRDPIHRRYHAQHLTFGFMYAWTERFVLPLSHDEVVHGKSPLIYKMPGDEWQKFANLRLLFVFMWTRPGKKLLFMGGEFAQTREWNHDRELDWWLDTKPLHAGVRALIGDLNRLHRELPALHELDAEPQGFTWIDCNNVDESVFVYRRRDSAGREVVIVINATPVVRTNHRIALPSAGVWIERLNSDALGYGGSGVGNAGRVVAVEEPWMSLDCSAWITVPPLGALVLEAPAVS